MNKMYSCKICGLHYVSKELMERCYAWCSRHESCNLEVARQSVEATARQKRPKEGA